MRRGLAFASLYGLVCLLICVFCGEAIAQSPAINPADQFVSRLQPVADPVGALPIELAPNPPMGATPTDLQPGDFGFVPLRTQDRATLFFRYMTSPLTYSAMAASATGSWIAGVPEGWGRTFRGYGQRTGTEFALYTAEEATRDVGDAALGLDPRYFSCRCSGLWHRSGHALKMTVLAYDGNGGLHPDLPRFVGDYGSSMLVTTWYPAPYSPLAQGIKMGHVQVGLDAGVNLLREFSPEIKQIFRAFRLAKAAQP